MKEKQRIDYLPVYRSIDCERLFNCNTENNLRMQFLITEFCKKSLLLIAWMKIDSKTI